MKRQWIILTAALGLLLMALAYRTAPMLHADSAPATQPLASVRVEIAHHRFTLAVAATDADREHGLMNVTHLPDDAGMVFVFGDDQTLQFWMKNTLIPLDLIYLDAVGRVTAIFTMQTEPGVPDDRLKRYTSPGPARFAIEINAGLCRTLPLRVGDTVTLPAQLLKPHAR